MMPLPENFRAHFYGHAHIGDGHWAGENLYRQIAGTENSPVCQFNISSLDHISEALGAESHGAAVGQLQE